jgi:site-specific DNA recombinase
MLQFQGMIAEYERAQILERSRRGKRYRAKAGEVSVLCGTPYGYRCIRKTNDEPARYEVDAVELEVVRLVYEKYTVDGLSIGAIARQLREMGPPTRRRVTRWERSVVWGMLRNPVYNGTACFNKTQVGPRQKVTKPFRLSGRAVHGEKTSAHERPRDEWIEVPVPAIVSEVTFSLAAERLAGNKRRTPPDHRDERRARLGILSQMRLRAVTHLDPQFGTQNPLLPLPLSITHMWTAASLRDC